MPPLRDLLWGIVYPALAAGCTWAFLGGGWFRRDARWVSSLAVALAFVIAYVGLLDGPPLEPTSAREWLFWVAAGGALLSPLEALRPRAAGAVRVLFVGGLVWIVLRRQYLNHWAGEGADSPFPELVLALGLTLVGWTALERVAKQTPGAGAPLVLWTLAAGLALCSLWSSSGLYAQLAGAVAAAMGAALVLAWLRPGTWFAGGGAGLAWGLLAGIGMAAHFYAQLGTTEVLLLAGAPLCALVPDLPLLRKQSDARRVALRFLLVAVPVALAAQRCYTDYHAQESADPYSDYGGYGG